MRKQRHGITMIEFLLLLVFIGVTGVLLGFLLPYRSTDCRNAAPRQCINNLRQVALGIEVYGQRYGCYPPACVADANGRPAHSWRVLILPFIDRQDLYDAYNFDQPWDGPDNSKLIGQMPSEYACPAHRVAGLAPGHTTYLALVGPKTIFPPTGIVAKADVRDGLDKTLMLAESDTMAVPWTAPRDLDVDRMSLAINDPRRPGISSRGLREQGATVAFADVSIRRLPSTTRPDALRAMLTINGGEAVELPEAQ